MSRLLPGCGIENEDTGSLANGCPGFLGNIHTFRKLQSSKMKMEMETYCSTYCILNNPSHYRCRKA